VDLFPRTLLWNLRRPLASGELKLEDDLDGVAVELSNIFHRDSLDLVELVMTVEEKGRTPKTVGELLKLLESQGKDDSPSQSLRK